jgi:dihydroorotate dehydrogenase (fumarate)
MDLTTSYLGLTLANPLVASACSLTGTPEGARRIEGLGFGALVVRSVFEEQLPGGAGAEAVAPVDPAAYLAHLRDIRAAVGIPVIASINCRSPAGWAAFAREIEATGVHALEMNLYDIVDDPALSSSDVETREADLVAAVAASTRLPVSVKLGPHYTALIPFARRLEAAGAKGLVLFNRFMQPDINIETGHLRFNVNFSRAEDVRMPLRWTAILREHVKLDLAVSGGVHDTNAAIQGVLVGGNAVCLCSALYLRHGANPAAEILDGLRGWLARKGHMKLDEIRGTMRNTNLGHKAGFERAHHVKTLGAAR